MNENETKLILTLSFHFSNVSPTYKKSETTNNVSDFFNHILFKFLSNGFVVGKVLIMSKRDFVFDIDA